MRYWEIMKEYMCFNSYDNQFKQRDINTLLWVYVNEDGKNDVTENTGNMNDNLPTMKYNQD